MANPTEFKDQAIDLTNRVKEVTDIKKQIGESIDNRAELGKVDALVKNCQKKISTANTLIKEIGTLLAKHPELKTTLKNVEDAKKQYEQIGSWAKNKAENLGWYQRGKLLAKDLFTKENLQKQGSKLVNEKIDSVKNTATTLVEGGMQHGKEFTQQMGTVVDAAGQTVTNVKEKGAAGLTVGYKEKKPTTASKK